MAIDPAPREFRYLKILTSPVSDFRIVIYGLPEGLFTFSKQWRNESLDSFGTLGPKCGIYDSIETAENEARLRNGGVNWD
jgi:hypothetical protein